MKSLKRRFGPIPIAVTSRLTKEKSLGDIVFIHMSWGGAWVFEFCMKFFSENGYNAHALDLRGHGASGSTVEGTSMQDYADDVQTAVDGLGLREPIIVGHSMGGLVALMYSAQHGSRATVSLDGSPPIETQKVSERKEYPSVYKPSDAGMPNPLKAMMVLSDIYPWRLMMMKMRLGTESGVARSERKLGVSVPIEKLTQPLLFVGAEYGASLPFGIGTEKVREQADYYGAPVVEIKGASHPGLLIGKHWRESAKSILDWLRKNNI